MPREERRAMIEKLAGIGYRERLEEESCDPYDTALLRLGEAGWPVDG